MFVSGVCRLGSATEEKRHRTKIYTVLHVIVHGCETWSRIKGVREQAVEADIGANEDVTGDCSQFHIEDFHDLYLPNIIFYFPFSLSLSLYLSLCAATAQIGSRLSRC